MLLNKLKKIVSARPIIYEYALSAAEVQAALYKVFRTQNQLHTAFDITGGFISDTEFEYDLITATETSGIKITFPMRGTIILLAEDHTKIILNIRSKFYTLLLLALFAVAALISLIVFFTNWEFKFLIFFGGLIFLAPMLLRIYLNAVSSALKIRYRKYLHNAILEAYRQKHYGK